VTGVGSAPPAVAWLWVAGAIAIAGVRTWGWRPAPHPSCGDRLLGLRYGVYRSDVGGSRLASHQAFEWLAERGDIGSVVMAGPLPANPFVRDIVIVDESHYHFVELNWLRRDRFQLTGPPIPRGPDGPVIDAALTAAHIQGLTTWMRFPAYSVEPLTSGFRVTIHDVRYARLEGLGLGTVSVELDRNLRVRPPR